MQCYNVEYNDFDLLVWSNNTNFKSDLEIKIKQYYFEQKYEKYTEQEMKIHYDVNLEFDDWDEMVNLVWKKDNPKYIPIQVSKISSCEGCRIGSLDQKSHIGGCL